MTIRETAPAGAGAPPGDRASSPGVKLPIPSDPPPGPFRRSFWRSPLRGPWLTSALGIWLLLSIPLILVTGFLSHVAYNPELGRNDFVRPPAIFDLFVFDWPTSPSWLYVLTQGLHVTVGIAAVPILLVKLWSVLPKLFEWPPVRSPAHALERLSLLLLVGGVLFQFVTGIFNVQIYYPWTFSFLTAHYYGAWVFSAGFLLHLGLKLPLAVRTLRARGTAPLRESLAHTTPERYEPATHEDPDAPTVEPSASIPSDPSPPTISRRGVLALAGGTSLALLIVTAGQSIGGPLRRLAVLAPHGTDFGDGPNDFQINKTAKSVGVGPAETGSNWRLELAGGSESVRLSRQDLLAMEQHTEELPIACVEGWSTSQTWTGVRLADLAARAGVAGAGEVLVESIQEAGSFRRASLSRDQVADERSLLALRVNGADLSLDHGFPARVIVPALPGVHCTKWVKRLEFARA